MSFNARRSLRPLVVFCDLPDPKELEAICRVFRAFRKTLAFHAESDLTAWLRNVGESCGALLASSDDDRVRRLIERIRDMREYVPITVLVPSHSRAICSDAYLAQARYIEMPVGVAELSAFVTVASVFDSHRDEHLADRVASALRKCELTPAELDIVLRHVRGERGAVLWMSRGVSENTYRGAVKSILLKTQSASMGELVRGLLSPTSR